MSTQINDEYLYKLITRPHISEKVTRVVDAYNQYVFQVMKDATKPEIKRAIEKLFKVEVSAVRVVTVPGKPRNFGQIPGRTKSWKKAYVTLKPGFQIDFAPAD